VNAVIDDFDHGGAQLCRIGSFNVNSA